MKSAAVPTTQSESEQAWALLTNCVGNYFGTGVNHEKQKYEASCRLTMEFPQKLISIRAEAKGMKGEVFHEEVSWLGRDHLGSLTLYVVSNNHKGITAHYFHRLEALKDGPKKVIFRFGEPEDKLNFREEITFAIHRNYNIEHIYAWGMPGGAFQTRSGSIMKKII
jgi:hypothetical protein